MTSLAFLFLVLGLTTNGISSVFGHATLALQETRASVAVTIASQAVAISLFMLLTPALAHAGLALASSLVPLATALLYFFYLTRFIPRLHRVFSSVALVKTVAAAALMAAAVWIVRHAAYNIPLNDRFLDYAVLLLAIPFGAVMFLALAHWWKIADVRAITALVRRKFSKLKLKAASTS